MYLLRLFNLAIQFSTRLPGLKINYTEKELGASGVFFPFVGFLLGSILYFEARLLIDTNIVTNALLIVVTNILLTGALHLDGFMDTMDGIMSGKRNQQMLTIMSDSHVGAHSVSMLFVLLLSKIAFLITILQKNLLLILIAPVIGRIIMLLCIVSFPYAKKQGIGLIYKSNLNSKVVYISAISIILFIVALSPVISIAIFSTLIVMFFFTKNVAMRIGGLTGDVYGAIAEISEVILLFFTFITYIFIGR